MSDITWRTEALDLPTRLAALNADGESLREAMFVVWSALASASSTIKHLFSAVLEADILTLASERDPAIGNFGLSFDGSETNGEIVRQLAGCLRAMELQFTTWDLGARPTDPEEWRVEAEGKSAYLIPMGRKAWREAKPPSKDNRPFDQRGVLRIRLIPSVVDGATVRLKMADHLSKPEKPKFGAVLFPEAGFECDETPTTFIVKAVCIPGGTEIISGACAAAHSDLCLATVFPELTIDPQWYLGQPFLYKASHPDAQGSPP